MRVSVVFSAAAGESWERDLDLPAGASVADALAHSGWARTFPAWSQADLSLSVWAREVQPHTLLQEGDRIELCRPLRVDPKTARRERFARQGARAAGLFARRKK